MKSSKSANQSLKDFFSYNGQYSHTRLISIVGSLITFVMFILNPLNDGIQNIVLGILIGSMTNASISKFSKETKQQDYGNESTGDEEVWSAEPEQPESSPMGRPSRARNRSNS